MNTTSRVCPTFQSLSHLDKIDCEEKKDLENIEVIILNKIKLIQIDFNDFSSCKNLTIIKIENNKISKISNSGEPLKLEEINLKNNQLEESEFTSQTLSHTA